MALLDTIQHTFQRLVPPKTLTKASGAIGGGHGMVPFDDDVSCFVSYQHIRIGGVSPLSNYNLVRLTVVIHLQLSNHFT
jgi:hypothetical protein